MRLGKIPKDLYLEYERLFRLTFRNADLLQLDFQKKLSGHGKLIPIPIAVFNEDDEIVSALTIYPQYYVIDKIRFLGGQIGDALTLDKFRGQGLFKKLVGFSEKIGLENNYNFLVTFPNTSNKGSYFAFIGNQWQPTSSIEVNTQYAKVSLYSRFIRKLGKTAYSNFEMDRISKLNILNYPTVFIPNNKSFGQYDLDFFKSKDYNNKYIIKVKSGSAYISIYPFHITLGLYQLNDEFTLKQLVNELVKICSDLGKDYLNFYFSIENNDIDQVFSEESRRVLEALVKPFNEFDKYYNQLRFNSSDIDTF